MVKIVAVILSIQWCAGASGDGEWSAFPLTAEIPMNMGSKNVGNVILCK